jgi:hypothetical protein
MREVVKTVRGPRDSVALEGMATFVLSLALIGGLATLMEAANGFPAVGSAVFVALAILTLPHMVVPRLVGAFAAERPSMATTR